MTESGSRSFCKEPSELKNFHFIFTKIGNVIASSIISIHCFTHIIAVKKKTADF